MCECDSSGRVSDLMNLIDSLASFRHKAFSDKK